MTTINIAGLTPIEDPSYRYKMPRVVGKVEGRGNGIKTVLFNVTEVAASLNRDAPEITKFFGCELGSQTTYANDTDRAVVNGAHRDQDLQSHLSKYIENFVLCKNCKLPETHYKIKDGMITQKCLACGAREPVDMTHKLTTFIIAQHKKNKEAAKSAEKKGEKGEKEKSSKSSDKKSSKEKDSKEGKKSKKDEEETSNGHEGGGKREGSPVEVKEEKKKSSKKKSAEDTVFTSATATAAAAAEEDESDSKAAEEAMERFKLWHSDNPSATPSQIVDELRNFQVMASLRPADRIIIYLGAAFSEQIITKKEISVHKAVLQALAPSDIQQRHLIAAMEWFCGTRHPQLLKYFPVVLKLLWDEELLEEDTLLMWAADFTRNEFTAEGSLITLDTLEQLKQAAQPFIKWLQEAEEEEEEGEEGEDDDEEEEGGEDSEDA